MKSKKRIVSLLSFFLLIILQFNSYAVDLTKTSNKQLDDTLVEVLVLCSYDYSMEWERNIVNEFTQTLKESYTKDLSVVVDFMDTKRYVSDEYNELLDQFLTEKYRDSQYDVVFAVDNAALAFVNKHYDSLFKDSLISFAGINNFNESMVSNIPHYYGIEEYIDYEANIELIKQVMTNLDGIYLINDNSLTGTMIREDIEKNINVEEMDKLHWIETVDLEYVINGVKVLHSNDAVLLLSFTKDMRGNTYTYEYMCDAITRNTSAKVFGVWDFYLNHGIVGGYLASSSAHGTSAGKAVAEALKQKMFDNTVIREKGNQIIFDHLVMEKKHLTTDNLPDNGILINYQNDGDGLINKLLLFGGLFTVFIIILSYLMYLFRRRTKENIALTEVADVDYLTGVLNRRKGLSLLENDLKQIQSKGEEYALIFFDLDGLKTINDQFGHNEGDAYIKDSVALIKHFTRKEDIFLRFGGDEFILVLKQADLSVAERICSRIETSMESFNRAGERRYKVSFSWGIETFIADDNTNVDMIINMADQKMYTAKYNKKASKS